MPARPLLGTAQAGKACLRHVRVLLIGVRCAQSAASSRSPVRTRTTDSTGTTHTLPSPIRPV